MNLKEWIDILLEAGTDHPKKWMAVPEYEEPSDDLDRCSDWYSEWKRLHVHHAKETTFLFEVIEELRKRLKEQK